MTNKYSVESFKRWLEADPKRKEDAGDKLDTFIHTASLEDTDYWTENGTIIAKIRTRTDFKDAQKHLRVVRQWILETDAERDHKCIFRTQTQKIKQNLNHWINLIKKHNE